MAGDDFHGMPDRFAAELGHLHGACRAVGYAGIRAGGVELLKHVRSDGKAQVEMIRRQAPCAGHAAAMGGGMLDDSALKAAEQLNRTVGLRLSL